jgi:hypothetical protein
MSIGSESAFDVMMPQKPHMQKPISPSVEALSVRVPLVTCRANDSSGTEKRGILAALVFFQREQPAWLVVKSE